MAIKLCFLRCVKGVNGEVKYIAQIAKAFDYKVELVAAGMGDPAQYRLEW